MTGVVNISFTVDAHELVKEPTVENATNEAFISPALKAVAQWKFKPGKIDGQPAEMKLSLPIYFSLEG
ncbi:MAG: TonB family protein [Opitutae bacterium]|nr:TonB family protein [Opitutae bacterium]